MTETMCCFSPACSRMCLVSRGQLVNGLLSQFVVLWHAVTIIRDGSGFSTIMQSLVTSHVRVLTRAVWLQDCFLDLLSICLFLGLRLRGNWACRCLFYPFDCFGCFMFFLPFFQYWCSVFEPLQIWQRSLQNARKTRTVQYGIACVLFNAICDEKELWR